jgi:hypothetical protein
LSGQLRRSGRCLPLRHDAGAQWHARGVRILARTTLEAVRDPLGARIGQNVARVAAKAPVGSTLAIVDAFAGSCNGLFSILRDIPTAEGLGFELEQAIFDMSTHNIALLPASIRLVHGDYRTLLSQYRFPASRWVVALLAPPWADALSAETGLDLDRTKPPMGEIIDDFERVYPQNPVLYVVEVHEHLTPRPLEKLRAKFDWSEQTYDIPGPTGRHGLLLGAKRWRA